MNLHHYVIREGEEIPVEVIVAKRENRVMGHEFDPDSQLFHVWIGGYEMSDADHAD